MSDTKLQLCDDLRLVYDFEVAHGNFVTAISAPAGTKCSYEVIFSEPLKIIGTTNAMQLPEFLQYWENRDPHYDIEAGYFCPKHKHSVAGPLED
jgi:hypothetical protein